jgi:hypothetical protein
MVNRDCKSHLDKINKMAARELAELRQIAIMYHSRGKTDEAAATFEFLDKFNMSDQDTGS